MVLKPPLKWAGGKRWLVPKLLSLWQQYPDYAKNRMVEPFCGGLSVSLGVLPERALLNDVNPHLINFYKQLQDGLRFKISMKAGTENYYANRTKFNDLINKGKAETGLAAQLFYYLNKTCYNGLCRFNSSGLFNVPFGQYARVSNGFNPADYSVAMKRWIFSCVDFSKIKLRDSDFVYADPPYDSEKITAFTKYSKDDFRWEDQVRLVDWLALHNGPVVLSNQATDRIVKLYKGAGYQCELFQAPRMISCDGNRRRAVEVLAIRNLP